MYISTTTWFTFNFEQVLRRRVYKINNIFDLIKIARFPDIPGKQGKIKES